jgi:hypothetical protein
MHADFVAKVTLEEEQAKTTSRPCVPPYHPRTGRCSVPARAIWEVLATLGSHPWYGNGAHGGGS